MLYGESQPPNRSIPLTSLPFALIRTFSLFFSLLNQNRLFKVEIYTSFHSQSLLSRRSLANQGLKAKGKSATNQQPKRAKHNVRFAKQVETSVAQPTVTSATPAQVEVFSPAQVTF